MIRKTLFLIVLTALLMTGCAPAASPAPVTVAPTATVLPATAEPTSTPVPAGMTLTDGLGRQVKLEAPAQRIVSLAPSLTEVLFAIGAGGQVVGRDDFSDYPEQALQLKSIGSTYETLNTEAILVLKPDLVLAAGFNSPEQIKALENLGVTVYFFENPTDFEGMYRHLEIMGELTGHSAEAQVLTATLQQRVTLLTAKVAKLTEKPTVFYEIDGTDPAKPWTTGRDTFMDAMIGMAGGVNIGGVLADPFAQISLEEVVKQDPAFIVLGDAKWGVTTELLGQRAGWDGLTAVKSGRVFVFDDNLASRPGPRLVDGLEALVAILHPELAVVQ